MEHPKPSVAGQSARLTLLANHGLLLTPGRIRNIRLEWGMTEVSCDDIIGAAACPQTANRVRLKQYRSFTSASDIGCDSRGLKLEIVA
jgi:hypothetical protein